MRDIRGIVFDFDGVIVDSEASHFVALQDTMAAAGWPLSKAEYDERYLGYSDRGTFKALNADRKLGLALSDIDRLAAEKGRRFAQLASAEPLLFPEAVECIQRLSGTFPLAIASGSLRHEIATVLDRHGLSPYFAAIVGADDVTMSKPDPAPYLEAARKLKMPPAMCAAIEDSPWGLESARAAGMFTIGVTHSYPAARLTAADAIVASLSEVTESLPRRR
jgi:beta-phosphoglucomutase